MDTPSTTHTKEWQIFAEHPVPRAVAAMAVPTIISQIITVIYNVADTWYVGLTGSAAAVAALALCLPVSTFMTAIANLFGIGGASVMARAIGRNDEPRAQRAFALAARGTLAAACLFALVLLVFARPFLMAIGGDSQNIGFALAYCRITLVLGAVPTILSAALAHLIRATGNARIASLGITGGAVLNMVLDPLFMFVLFPDGYEVVGAAAATTLSHTLCLCFFLLYILKKNSNCILRFSLNDTPKEDSVLPDILRCGFPGFCLVAMGQVSNFFLNGMIASLGASNAVAAIGIVRRIDSLAYSFNQGITQGMLPIAAFCFSSRRYGRMKRVIAFSAACTMSFSLVCSFLSYVYAPQLIELFIRDDATIAYGVQFLRILCIAVAIYPLLFVIIASFQAAGQSVRPFILSLLHRGTFDIALFFLIRRIWGLDYVLWASPIMAAVALLTSIVLYARFLRSLNQSHTFKSPR